MTSTRKSTPTVAKRSAAPSAVVQGRAKSAGPIKSVKKVRARETAAVLKRVEHAIKRTGGKTLRMGDAIHVFDMGAFKQGVKGQRYGALLKTSSFQRIDLVRTGLPAGMVHQVADDMGVDRVYLGERLGLARSTLARKVSKAERLSPRDSENVLGAAEIVGLVETMVSESGAPDGFDAAAWVGDWITQPHPALGNREPAALLDTVQGLQLVTQVLRQSQSGAYA